MRYLLILILLAFTPTAWAQTEQVNPLEQMQKINDSGVNSIPGLGTGAIDPAKLQEKMSKGQEYIYSRSFPAVVKFAGSVMIGGVALLIVGAILNSRFIKTWGWGAIGFPIIAVTILYLIPILLDAPSWGMKFLTE